MGHSIAQESGGVGGGVVGGVGGAVIGSAAVGGGVGGAVVGGAVVGGAVGALSLLGMQPEHVIWHPFLITLFLSQSAFSSLQETKSPQGLVAPG